MGTKATDSPTTAETNRATWRLCERCGIEASQIGYAREHSSVSFHRRTKTRTTDGGSGFASFRLKIYIADGINV